MFGNFFQLSDYQLAIQELVHDLAGIDFTANELTLYANEARNKVAEDFHNVRFFLQGAAFIAAQEQYPITGGICGVQITNAGNYPTGTAPSVTFSSPLTGGVQATATSLLTSTNAVQQVNMTNWGQLYQPTLAAPATVTFSTATGSGAVTATGNPLVQNNTFDVIKISVLWGTQKYTLSWAPFDAFQAYARANPTLQSRPVMWSNITEENLLFVYPIPDQTYLADIDMIGLPMPLVNPTDVDQQINPPLSTLPQYWAAYKAMIKLQRWQDATYFESLYEKRRGQLWDRRQDRRLPNVYRAYARRIARW
jgi:hypothetical protein